MQVSEDVQSCEDGESQEMNKLAGKKTLRSLISQLIFNLKKS